MVIIFRKGVYNETIKDFFDFFSADYVCYQQFPISRYALLLGGMRESAFVNFLEQSHDAAGGWPRYGEPPAVG